MEGIKVRNLSALIKVECVDDKQEQEQKCFEDEKHIHIKVEPDDDVDMNDNKTFFAIDEQVLKLIKRTLKHEKEKCVCKQCGKLCDTKYDLEFHINQLHIVKRPTIALRRSLRYQKPFEGYGCVNCSERFATYRQSQQHVFLNRNISPFQCRYCNKFFHTIRKAESHSRYAHNRSSFKPNFVCRTCYLPFYDANAYERHLRVHREKPYNCTICFIRFDRMHQFHDHLIELHSTIRKEKGQDMVKIQENESIPVRVKQEPRNNEVINVVVTSSNQQFIVKSEVEDIAMKSEVEDVFESSILTVKSETTVIKEEPMDTDPTNVDRKFECGLCSELSPCKESFLIHMQRHMVLETI